MMISNARARPRSHASARQTRDRHQRERTMDDDPIGIDVGVHLGAAAGERPSTAERPATASAIDVAIDAPLLSPLPSARGAAPPTAGVPPKALPPLKGVGDSAAARAPRRSHLRPAARGIGASLVARRGAPAPPPARAASPGAAAAAASSSGSSTSSSVVGGDSVASRQERQVEVVGSLAGPAPGDITDGDESSDSDSDGELEVFGLAADVAAPAQHADAFVAGAAPVAKEPERATGGSSLPPLAGLIGSKGANAAKSAQDPAAPEASDSSPAKLADPFGSAVGLKVVSSRLEGAAGEDDEFGYAFAEDGGKREYVPQALSSKQAALLTGTAGGMGMDAFAECDEEDDYHESDEELSQVEQASEPNTEGDSAASAAPAAHAPAPAPATATRVAPERSEADEWDAANAQRAAEIAEAPCEPAAAQESASAATTAAAGLALDVEVDLDVGLDIVGKGHTQGGFGTDTRAEKGARGGLSWEDARKYILEGAYVHAVANECVVQEERAGCMQKFLAACVAPSPLSGSLEFERLACFALAKTPLGDSEPSHVGMLTEVYRQVTGKVDSEVKVWRVCVCLCVWCG